MIITCYNQSSVPPTPTLQSEMPDTIDEKSSRQARQNSKCNTPQDASNNCTPINFSLLSEDDTKSSEEVPDVTDGVTLDAMACVGPDGCVGWDGPNDPVGPVLSSHKGSKMLRVKS